MAETPKLIQTYIINIIKIHYQNTKRKKNLKFTDKVLKADKINYENMIRLVITLAKKVSQNKFCF